MALYHRAFGWAPWQVFDHVAPIHHNTELRGQKVHYALRGAEVYVGTLNFELLQPLEGPNLWSEFLDKRGEGIASFATMFHEQVDGDAVKVAFRERFGAEVLMKADIGSHIEYYYLDTEAPFGCLIESGSGHAIDFVKPVHVYPAPDAEFGPSPLSSLIYPLTQVSLVVRDLEARLRAFHEAFGWGPWKLYDSSAIMSEARYLGEPAAFALRFAQAPVNDMTFELIEPLGGASPWQDFLDTKDEGLCGISVTLASSNEFARAEAQFAELGIGVLARGKVGGSADWLILDSERDFKCLVQIGTGHAYAFAEPSRVYP